jgi:hypothetical protein
MELDQQQNDLFLTDANKHSSYMKDIRQQQKQILEAYFQSLLDTNQVQHDTLLSQFQAFEKTKIEATYQHFEYIKSILNPNQMVGYEKFVKKIMKKALVGDRKKPPPPNRR